MALRLDPISSLSGIPIIPGDKSISHRVLFLGALSRGTTAISNLLDSEDIQSTQKCLASLGIEMENRGSELWIRGADGWGSGFRSPRIPLDCGNSGTTMRLLAGVLAGQNVSAVLVGDPSLSRRPMKRIADPLNKMGAKIQLVDREFAPLQINPNSELKPIDYTLETASSQVKSAILLAGVKAPGRTTVRQKFQSRDHTERLLSHFGGAVEVTPGSVSILGQKTLYGRRVQVPNDFSSAAFWIAAALIVPGSVLEFENLLLNPTRTGFLNVLKRMGASIESEMISMDPEPIGRLRVRYSSLQATSIEAEEIPLLIDELPLVAILAPFAEGTTKITGARELRFKETDRIEAIARNLRAMKVKAETNEDGFSIPGPQPLCGAQVDSFGDHRIAMAFSIAASRAKSSSLLVNSDCVSISYPRFYETLRSLSG